MAKSEKESIEFKKIEEKLYNYFGARKKIASLNHQIEILDKQIKKIDEELRNADVSIGIESTSLMFREKVQTSGTGESYQERELMRITDMKLKRKKEKEIKKEQCLALIDNIELANAILDYNIQNLNNDIYKILEYKYKEKYKEWQIAAKMNITQGRVNQIKQQAIEEIKHWEEWNIIKN